MKIEKQLVYIPVDVEKELPKQYSFTISTKNEQMKYGEIHKECGEYRCGSLSKEITHWLKPTEAYVFTPEQLKQLLEEYTNRIIEKAEVDVEYSMGQKT
jgi:hypothetical protein